MLQSGGRIDSGPQMGLVYMTHAVWGVPNASQRGIKSAVVHKWADWLHSPCRLWGLQHFRVGAKITSGPQMGLVAIQPLPSGGPQRFGAGDEISSGPQVGLVYMTHAV